MVRLKGRTLKAKTEIGVGDNLQVSYSIREEQRYENSSWSLDSGCSGWTKKYEASR